MQEFLLLVELDQVVVSGLQNSSTPNLAVAVKLVTCQWSQVVYLYAGTWPVVALFHKGNLALGLMVQEHSQPCQ